MPNTQSLECGGGSGRPHFPSSASQPGTRGRACAKSSPHTTLPRASTPTTSRRSSSSPASTTWRRGPKVGECQFDRGAVPVYQGRYRGKVVESHTGKKVGDVAIDGASAKDCPIITLVKGDAEDNKLYTAPKFAEVQRILGAFVDGQTR